jgi:hypothetical protein
MDLHFNRKPVYHNNHMDGPIAGIWLHPAVNEKRRIWIGEFSNDAIDCRILLLEVAVDDDTSTRQVVDILKP